MQNLYIMLIAFLAGLVLNIMPCVLPVLSIKLLTIAKYSGKSKKEIKQSFLSLSLGIIVSFLAFAGIVIFLKYLGRNIGWDFCFRNPYFVMCLILFFTLLSCMVMGFCVIEIFPSIDTLVLNKPTSPNKIYRKTFLGNFIGGIFAFLFSIPCSAPLLLAMLSFALTMGYIQVILVFLAMGVGMAMPFILMSIYTNTIKFIPKAGDWMFTLKGMLLIVILSIILWLLYILYLIAGIEITSFIALLCIVLIMQFRAKKILVKFLIVASVFFIGFTVPMRLAEERRLENIINPLWGHFEFDKIYEHIRDNKAVIVLVYADWSMTSGYTNIDAFNSDEIMRKITEENLVAMKINKNQSSDKVLYFLERHSKFKLPYYIMYSKKFPLGFGFSGSLNKTQLLTIIELTR